MSIAKVRCINWEHQGSWPIQYFYYNNFKKCFSVAPAHSLVQILFAKAGILVKIFAHNPNKGENHIQNRNVKSLELMKCLVRMLWRKSNDCFSNVLVVAHDIRICMMKNVVLYFPIDIVSTH